MVVLLPCDFCEHYGVSVNIEKDVTGPEHWMTIVCEIWYKELFAWSHKKSFIQLITPYSIKMYKSAMDVMLEMSPDMN